MKDSNDKSIAIYIEDELIPDLPIPPDGKAWMRKSDGEIYNSAIILGMLHFQKGKRLKKPIREKQEDFELIDLNKKENE